MHFTVDDWTQNSMHTIQKYHAKYGQEEGYNTSILSMPQTVKYP